MADKLDNAVMALGLERLRSVELEQAIIHLAEKYAKLEAQLLELQRVKPEVE